VTRGTRYRFRYRLGELGPVVPAQLEAAARRVAPEDVSLRVGMFGRVEGVQDGRPIGTQAIDLEASGLTPATARDVVTEALARLGIAVQTPPPDVG
jgi:hypothetical protein